MATVVPFLDKRRIKNDGTYPLRLNIAHNKRSAVISLNISLRINEWDELKRRVKNKPDDGTINKYIEHTLSRVRQFLLTKQEEGQLAGKSASQIRKMVIAELNPEDVNSPITFKQWFDRFSSLHTNQRTQDIYKATWNAIEKFDPQARLLTFENITKGWLEQFFTFMFKTSPSVNARNIHLRNIRAVFNDAIDNEITKAYPFRRLKIKPEATAKRNLSPEELRNIFCFKVQPWQQKYIDMFKLSFFFIGINTIDLFALERISHGRIEYKRAKTHKLYSIKVEPEALELIEKYRGQNQLLNFAENRKYRCIANRLNLNLKRLFGITTYYARHSWATIAASLDVPDDTIAFALGHSSANATTSLYIERNRRKIDIANRAVINYVLYDKK